MKKFLFALIAASALMSLLPSAHANGALCQEDGVRVPLSVQISKDK